MALLILLGAPLSIITAFLGIPLARGANMVNPEYTHRASKQHCVRCGVITLVTLLGLVAYYAFR